MQLAERIQVKRSPALSALCHRAKNLYNLANFYVRQERFIVGDVLTYFDLCFMFRGKRHTWRSPRRPPSRCSGRW